MKKPLFALLLIGVMFTPFFTHAQGLNPEQRQTIIAEIIKLESELATLLAQQAPIAAPTCIESISVTPSLTSLSVGQSDTFSVHVNNSCGVFNVPIYISSGTPTTTQIGIPGNVVTNSGTQATTTAQVIPPLGFVGKWKVMFTADTAKQEVDINVIPNGFTDFQSYINSLQVKYQSYITDEQTVASKVCPITTSTSKPSAQEAVSACISAAEANQREQLDMTAAAAVQLQIQQITS